MFRRKVFPVVRHDHSGILFADEAVDLSKDSQSGQKQGEANGESFSSIVQTLDDSDRRLLDWHWANLEYGCSARLSDVSLAHWNQVCFASIWPLSLCF